MNYESVEKIFSQRSGPKCLPFLRQRFRAGQLGVIVGAGISLDCGVPVWAKLVSAVRAITGEPKNHLAGFQNDTFLTEIAWRRFREERLEIHKQLRSDEKFIEEIIESEWLQRVRDILFRDVTPEKVARHPYLKSLSVVVNGCDFNISFNFENILDREVAEYAASMNTLLPTTTTTIAPIRQQSGATIFHINGLLPAETNKKSTKLVFSEEAFANILTREDVRKKEFLLTQFAEKTFVLLGLSLNDKSLTNLLRASKDRNPGCHHIYIHYMDNEEALTDIERKEIYDVNLHVYNLITLFLCNKEINTFLQLIHLEDGSPADVAIARSGAKPRYVYYIVGCPAAGKTTLLENLRCFITIEEWTQRLPEIMYQNYEKLSESEQKQVDEFLDIELVRKGKRTRANELGIILVDRAPLDLFAFSKTPQDNLKKVRDLEKAVLPALNGAFDDGHIIFLEADVDQLALRQARRGRAEGDMNYTGQGLAKQSRKLKDIYQPPRDQVFDNSNQTDLITTLKVALHILFQPYNPTSFASVIDRCKEEMGAIGILK